MKYVITLLALSLSLTTLAQTKNSFFEKGSKLLDKKDYKGAKEAFSAALEQDSTLDNAYYNRALAEFNLKEMDAALLDFKIYNVLNPQDEDAMDLISFIYYFKDDYAGLKASVQKFMNIASTEYNSNYFLGYACYYLDEYKPAIEYLTNQLTLEPNTQDALYYRAKSYIELDQANEAEQDLTQLINLKDDYLLAHYYRAILRKDRENYVEALADIHKSVQQNPDDTDFLLLRGEIHEALKDFLAAKADYDRAVELKGTNVYEVLYKRALLNYLELGEKDAALADLTAVIKGSPKTNTLASFIRGLLYTENNQLEEANADFESVIKLDSNYTEVYFYWAEVKLKMEQYDEALRLITIYLKDADTLSEPDLANAYQLIGKVHLQQKDFAAALQAFDKSLAYDDEIGETHFWFAKTLIALKRKDEACTSLYKALDLGYEDAELELEEECGYSIQLEEDQE